MQSRLCHCTPAWIIEQDSVSKDKKKEGREGGREGGEREEQDKNNILLKMYQIGLGVVPHAYNPRTLGGRGRWIT